MKRKKWEFLNSSRSSQGQSTVSINLEITQSQIHNVWGSICYLSKLLPLNWYLSKLSESGNLQIGSKLQVIVWFKQKINSWDVGTYAPTYDNCFSAWVAVCSEIQKKLQCYLLLVIALSKVICIVSLSKLCIGLSTSAGNL